MKLAIHKLRVNIKSLAAESRYIRAEVKKTYDRSTKAALNSHRATRVRPEARLAHLALAYLKGVPYRAAENNAHTKPERPAVIRKLQRFTTVDPDKVSEWLEQQSKE